MAYFLKVSNIKKGKYLQIYESFYDATKKQTAHKCYKTIGYYDELISNEIPDPIQYYKNQVITMNEEAKIVKAEKKLKEIDSSPIRYAGYTPIKNIYDGLGVSPYLKLLASSKQFQFDLDKVIEALIYARCVKPCSKFKTFHEVIPFLLETYDFSYDQLLEGLSFVGEHYEKVVEIFTKRVSERYGISTDKTYFDCTNFYFEIDREKGLQRKGPSKENRKDPIVGMGLLLDSNLLPMGMKIYPGNQSEKPVLRDIITELKLQNHIIGKTVQVADKGLNCAANIYKARKDKDGYLFSKSVKTLKKTEQEWVLLPNDYKSIYDEDTNLLYQCKSCVDTFEYSFIDEDGTKQKFKVKEKRLATFNQSLADKHTFEINKMVEKATNLQLSLAKKSEYGESSKYVTFKSTSNGEATDESIAVSLNIDLIQKDLALAGYNLLVTSEITMKNEEIYDVYHNLWRIEQSFRIMKSELDARPVFVQGENSIKGHFLICYLSVLLCRVLEFKVLRNQFCSSKIYDFLRSFTLIKYNDEYINISTVSPLLKYLSTRFSLPFICFNISEKQVTKMLNNIL